MADLTLQQRATRQAIRAQASLRPAIVAFNSSVDFRRWGDDNRQPQRYIEAVAGSGTASSCVETKAKLLEGNSFFDTAFYQAVVNDDGQTVDELLTLHAENVATLEGLAFLVNINLNGYPCEALQVPFEKWRPHKKLTDRCYLLNQVHDPAAGRRYRNADAVLHPVYDPREKPEDRLARINGWKDKQGNVVGLEGYPGEVAYWWRRRSGANHHPRPVYDAVLEDMYAEARLKVSRHVDIAEGFGEQVQVTEYGTTQPTQEVLDANQVKYGAMIGENRSRLTVQYAENKDMKPDVDTFAAPDASKRYQTSEEAIKVNIREAFQLPSVLIGREVAGKLGTSTEFSDALKYVQRMVINRDQRAIERLYEAVFSQFQPAGGQPGSLNPSGNYTIQNLTLEAAAAGTNDATPADANPAA